MRIRSERSYDHANINAVHTACFPTPAEARLVDGLRSAGRLVVSLVAEERDQVVGHVAFSPVRIDGAATGVGLAPVAVLPGFRRRGIAERLVREGLRCCGQLEYGFVVVLGDPAYYRRFGFMPASRWQLRDQYGGEDAFQALELRPGQIPPGGGLVRYAPEFATAAEEPLT